MTQEQLSKTLFPLGTYTKPKIRELAGVQQLITANKPESQDICFIPDGNYAAFIERHFPHLAKKQGPVKHVDGRTLGTHEGIHRVTVGQRKGLGIAFGEPLYVTHINAQENTVTVGPREATNRQECLVERVNWIAVEPKVGESFSLTIRIRSRSPEAPGTVTALENSQARITFDKPQHAITPGQAAVFYDGERVFGGGWITGE